jgi:hypothetical protein
LEAVFILLEVPSPSRRIFIGSHSLPPLWFVVSVLQSAILQSHFHINFGFKAALEDAWDYSRRLQDYSSISWSTFQPRDASNILEDFWLVVLRDA